MTRLIQTCAAIGLAAALLLGIGATMPALAAPVLTNGDFEDNPPPNMGNNFTNVGAPWIYGSGQGPNVVKVDGPGGYNYGSSGPESDASAPGAGVPQHYLDIADGNNDFYQVFTPLCTGEVVYSASFSSRANSVGVAGITIVNDTDSSIVGARQQTSLPAGNSMTDPWVQVTYTTSLAAGTAYRFLVDMDNNMNMDNAFVEFETYCPQHADQTVTKTCAPASLNADGTVAISCDITVTSGPLGAGTTELRDAFTMGGNAVGGVTAVVTSPDPWVCDPVSFLSSATPICTIDNMQFPASGTSTVNVALTLPEGTTGTAENCARMRDDGMAQDEDGPGDCVEIVLPDPVEDVDPQLCTAFEPEVTCDTATGETIVTLTNSANGFDPSQIAITSQTSGVGALQSSANPLQVLLTGAQAGQNISLWVDAIEKDGGSAKGLDTCCMGEISVQIPEDFVCERPPVLEVTKTCENIDGPVAQMQRCTIDVTYSGPPPSPALTVTDTLSGAGATLTGLPSSTDNWACTGTAPATCTIDAASDPSIDWSNFNSTLVFDVLYQDEFENCANAAASGIEDEACYSSADPDLTITKTANQAECTVGQPCDFTITVTNPSASNFSGPISLTDAVIANPYGQFTAIAPPLCPIADIASGTCTGNASIPAGGAQAYTVTWVPTLNPAGDSEYSTTNCAGVSSAGGTAGYQLGNPETAGNLVCATVTILPPDIEITKTGPATCDVGETCIYDITVTNGAAPYSGPILIYDTAPTGFNVVSVTPAPAGCGGGLPAQSFICVTQASLPANGSQTYQMSIQGNLSADMKDSENCAGLFSVSPDAAVGDYSTNGPGMSPALQTIVSQGTQLGEACVFVTVPDDIDDPLPICGNGTVEAGEMCDDGNGANGDGCSNQCTVGSLSNLMWIDKVCAPAVAGPMGLDIACTITINANGPWPVGGIKFTEVMGQSLSPSDTGATLGPIGWPDIGATQSGLTPPNTPVNLNVTNGQLPSSGTTTINAVVHVMNEGYLYETNNCATVQALDANGQPIGPPITDCENFTPPATAKVAQTGPDLVIQKTPTGPCTADLETRTYTCDFKITVTNAGSGDYLGPVVLTDTFKGPAAVSDVTFSGPLDCRRVGDGAFCLNGDASVPAGGEAFILLKTTHPADGPMTFQNCPGLGAGDDPKAQAMVVQTALKALGKYDGGIDGQIGRKSRAAIADLQTALGLPATGEIDQSLMDGLGVPNGEPAPCVTVALPPMPEPPKVCEEGSVLDADGNCACAFDGMTQTSETACECPKGTDFVAGKGCVEIIDEPKGASCDRATTVAKGGECLCKFKSMYQKDETSCGCIKGTKFAPGKGCIKPQPKETGTPKGPRCDLATTIERGGKCVCSIENYLPISPTQCAHERKVKRECPKGLVFLMGMGCVEKEIYFDGGGGQEDKGEDCETIDGVRECN